MGKANTDKAKGFWNQRDWAQVFRYAELAAIKLKKLKDRRLETVQMIDEALTMKFDALQLMARHREALECAKERYTMWAMNHLRNPGSMKAALRLIESCLHNNECEDAERYARHAMFMINDMTDNFIPVDQRPKFLADVSYYLAAAILYLANAGDIPPGEKQKVGEEAITLARQAIEIHTQLLGVESNPVATDMISLADALDYFNGVDDDEVLRLYEQAIAIYRRVEGSSSYNVAVGEGKLGAAYHNRAHRASVVYDLSRCLTNLELALPHYREAARIYRTINHVDTADMTLRSITRVDERILETRNAIAAMAAVVALMRG